MVRLAFFLITAGFLAAAGSPIYAEPPADAGDEPPVLLKKKGAADIDAPKPDADKKDKEKKGDDAPKPDADKGAPPEKPQVDAEEVLKRVAKNMHTIEDRLAKKELGDATRQAQDDALKDLDSLIDLTENPPESKDGQNNSSSSSDSSSKPDASKSSASKGGGSGSSSPGSPGKGKSQGKGKGRGKKQNSQPGAGGGQSSADKQPGGQQPAGDSSNSKGGKDVMTTKDHNADLYKDIWGHLPETLRAEMNAYSNTKAFMPEYEALISKYYRTIAEQGRRKGD